MKIFFLILLLTSTPALAQKSLSQQVFQVNIRPVLSGIINDFYQMISLFPDFPRPLIGLVEQMDNMEEIKENLRSTCPSQLNDKCQITVDDLRRRLTDIEARTLLLWSDIKPDSSVYMTSLIGMRLISEFKTELTLLKGNLDNASFLMRARIAEPRGTFILIKKLDELQTILSLVIVEFMPFQYKEDFRSFFFNFVRPIESHLNKNKNYEYLNRNVNSLNFAINLLNQNLTKRNKKTPEGMAPYLSLIHNRWNSLLRYYFF